MTAAEENRPMGRPSWSRSEPPGWMTDSLIAELSSSAETEDAAPDDAERVIVLGPVN